MSIKSKILIPMVTLTVLVAVAVLISNIMLFSNYVDSTMIDRVDVASAVAEDKLASLRTESAIASVHIAEDAAIAVALAARDREALLARSVQLQQETGVEFCTIVDREGLVLARAHEPEKFGDSILSQANVSSALSGKTLTAVERGTAVLLSVRSGSPVVDNEGRLIGVVSVGYRLDTETFVDSVRSILNCEVTLFLGDERISTTVTKEDGSRAVGTKAMEHVSAQVMTGQDYVGEAEILGRNALTKYTPIRDAGGDVVGMLFVGRYLDEKTSTMLGFMRTDLLILLGLLALSVPGILALVKRIVAPIHRMVEASRSLAAGEVDISVEVNTKDEMRRLAEAFNEMINNSRMQAQTIETIAGGDLTVSVKARSEKDLMNQALNHMLDRNNSVFAQISGSASQVTMGARQIADSAQSLAQGATEQASAVEQLSASISQIASKTKANAQMADQAATLAGSVMSRAESGSRQMDELMTAVNEINQASHSINKVIKVIDDIAFQTNILALNAAVEAARAGQHGKGFAVVAEEVRSLAAKSAAAAKDTGNLIANSMEKADLGTRIAMETATGFTEIVSGIQESSQLVHEIARSSEEQSEGIAQINYGIEQVALVVQRNSATSQESAAASEEMSGQAGILQSLIAQFKIKDGEVERFHRLPSAEGALRGYLAVPAAGINSDRIRSL